MRAAVLTDGGGFEVADLADPSPGPHDLVLAVGACGICGSDLKMTGLMAPGTTMGHEFAGEVVAVGSEVTGWSEGQSATALPLVGCGHCRHCVVGNVHHCATVEMVGLGGRPGAFAEYVRVGARESHALPPELDTARGALVEPLAVALHAVHAGGVGPGSAVLVLGGGPVGLASALWAERLGAAHVVVSDPVARRRALALRAGAGATLDPATEEVRDIGEGAAFAELTGRAPDVVIEAVGVPGLIQTAADAAGVTATVVIAGVCTSPDPFVPIVAITKELTMRFVVFYRSADFATTIDLLARDRLDPSPLVTGHVGLDGLDATFEALRRPTDHAKVLVTPGSHP